MVSNTRIRSASKLPVSKHDGHRFIVIYVLPLPVGHGFIVHDTKIDDKYPAMQHPGRIVEDKRYSWERGEVTGYPVRKLVHALNFDEAEALAGRLNTAR